MSAWRIQPAMRGLTLVLALACAAGSVKRIDGAYAAPNGRFSCDVGPTQVRDFYDPKVDRGMAEFFDDWGMQAAYFTNGTNSLLPTRSEDRASDLAAAKARFALPNVLAPRGSKGAQVLHEQVIPVGGEPALFLIVDIPGSSGAFNATTGKHFSAKVAALIFIRADYVFVLTLQSNMGDVELAKPGSQLPVADFTNGITKFYQTCSFPAS